jgi:probable O-glycosylation ligase (exosortase A-associated)
MRDTALILGFVAMLAMGRIYRYPHVGVLLWCWTALVVPNFFSYGIAADIPYNKVVAIITLIVWLFSREPKTLPPNATLVLLAWFALWGTISALTGIASSDAAMVEWDKFIKIIVFAFVVAGLITSKDRIIALLYAAVFSLGFHGALSGAKYLASGGVSNVWGPGLSIIGDNNHFALAMVILLPVIFFLYRQSTNRLWKLALIGLIALVVVSIMGTSSRGGLVGALALGALAFLRSPKKLRNAIIFVPLLVAVFAFAPAQWTLRMDTITEANQDTSFMSRVTSWKQSTLLALDHPIFGGGFWAIQDTDVWLKYAREFHKLDFIPSGIPNENYGFAAHSIYFQTLGDLGFVGLGIFLAILISSWRNASATVRAVRDRPEWHWARDLAKSLQYSLFAYAITGASLNMAYFDYMYMIFALLVVLRRLVSQAEETSETAAQASRWMAPADVTGFVK